MGYWRKQLSNLPAMPLERLQMTGDDTRSTSLISTKLPAERVARLSAFARERSVTPFMVTFAAFVALLSRCLKCDDLVVGTDHASRNRQETESLIGFFVNHLVLRVNLSGNSSFAELLSCVRIVVIEAYTHADVPFDYVVQQLHPKRIPSKNPLFQVKFVFQEDRNIDFRLQGLNCSFVDRHHSSNTVDLLFNVALVDDGLVERVEYNTAMFSLPTVENLIKQYATLLANLLQYPDQPIALVPLVGPEDADLYRALIGPGSDLQPADIDDLSFLVGNS